MGNNIATGHAMAMTGLPQAAGFHKTLGQMMYQYNIQPWDPKVLLQACLQKQQELQKSSPLRFIQVEDGLQFYGSQLGGVINTLTREKFVEMSQVLFRQKGLHLPVEEARLFYDIFDSIDLYKNATLSLGELAGGLSSFFGGTVEAKTSAVFELLAGGGEQVPKARLQELLKPYVWCMVPPHAESLRPILLPHVAEEIYCDMTLSGSGYLTRAEMQRWAQRGTFAQGQVGPNAANMSYTIIDRAALAISVALQVAWQEYDSKYKLREYGQQTWQTNYGNQPQQLNDIGARRYVAQAGPAVAANTSSAFTYVTQAGPAVAANTSSAFTSVGQVSNQLFQSAAQGVADFNVGFSSWLNQDNSPTGRRDSVDFSGRRLSDGGISGTTTIVQSNQSGQPALAPQPALVTAAAAPQPVAAASISVAMSAPALQPPSQSPFAFGNLGVIPGVSAQAPASNFGVPVAAQAQRPIGFGMPQSRYVARR